MDHLTQRPGNVPAAMGRQRATPVVLFAATLLTSAILLFWIQPLTGKMVLPLLGGAPAVWNTVMVFFQLVLLAGYVYAYLFDRKVPVRFQVPLHLIILLCSLLWLPPAISGASVPYHAAAPAWWLLGQLLGKLGVPCMLIASTAPLLQAWFAHGDASGSKDPFFLYAASNAGSLIALLGFPFLLEPVFAVSRQLTAWSMGIVLLAVLIAASGSGVWRQQARISEHPPSHTPQHASQREHWLQRGHWALLSFIPASLLLGVTLHISTDIAPVPLLWVLPLATYLLTFMISFSRSPVISHRAAVAVQAPAIFLLALSFALRWSSTFAALPLHLVCFFLTALVCHGELYKRRPEVGRLTEFYLWIALGGLAGGGFNAFAAPLLFDTTAEYPIVLILACIVRPWGGGAESGHLGWRRDILTVAVSVTILIGLLLGLRAWTSDQVYTTIRQGLLLLASVAGWLRFHARPLGFALGVAIIIAAGETSDNSDTITLARGRNFFGVIRVERDAAGCHHVFTHGRTVHGAQATSPEQSRTPLLYHHPDGPLGKVFDPATGRPVPKKVAVIGLGAGAIAAYGTPGQEITFYELDPDVVNIARDPRYFTYLRDSRADIRIILGDARVMLARSPDRSYDLIIFDAFSSDAIPVHLVTLEALTLYLSKLNDKGLLAFNVSNRYLDLEPVMSRLAAEEKLFAMASIGSDISTEESWRTMRAASSWIVMSRRMSDVGLLPMLGRWKPAGAGKSTAPLWTDGFSNVLGQIKWKSIWEFRS